MDVFAGGQIKCEDCGRMASVPESISQQIKTIHFKCPHCEASVVARKASAGKHSHCPVCGDTYEVPLPEPEAPINPTAHSQRIEIGTEDVAAFPKVLRQVREMQPIPLVDPTTDTPLPVSDDTRIPVTPAPAEPLPVEAHTSEPTIEEMWSPTTVESDGVVEPADVVPTEEVVESLDRVVPADPPVYRETVASEAVAASEATAEDLAAYMSLDEVDEAESGLLLEAELWGCGGEFDGLRMAIIGPKFLIGRERDCHLRAGSRTVSQHHCVLRLDGYSVRIRDLGSRNGTFVNGWRVRGDVVLCHTDMIRISDVFLRFVVPRDVDHASPKQLDRLTLDDFTIH
jgi:predicted RNA-binding Zn-ribbon protein involved in translation (DUF1610 family)